jgi:hypothetical protein
LNSSQYYISRSDQFYLNKRNGAMSIPLFSSKDIKEILNLYSGICTGEYSTEQELFNSIYHKHPECSIVDMFKQTD